MFHIEIRNVKLLHSYPKNQICKKQILDAFPPPYTHTDKHTVHTRAHKRAHIHTCRICTNNKNKLRKKDIYSVKKQIYSKRKDIK